MKKFLLIRFSSIGDIVLTEPVARLLKIYFLGCQIHYLTKPIYQGLIESFGTIDKIHLWNNKLKDIDALKVEDFDYVIDLHNKLNSFLVRVLLSAKINIIYNKQFLLRRMIVQNLTSKSVDSVVWNYLNVFDKIEGMDFDKASIKSQKLHFPTLEANKSLMIKIEEKFISYNVPEDHFLVGIFLGAQHKTKQCPVEKLANVLFYVPENWRCCFLILGDWYDKSDALYLKSLSDSKIIDLAGAFKLEELIGVISKLDCIISNDSGPMHLAAALKKKQIAIFGATHTKLGFRPLNDSAIVIQANVKCQPCSLHGGTSCPRNSYICFSNITSEEIFEEFKYIYETTENWRCYD